MYIEKKNNSNFLTNKYFQKKFSIKIDRDWINEETLKILTTKECDFIYETKEYRYFEDEIKDVYNPEKLREIIFKSRFLTNNIDILDLLKTIILDINEKKLNQELSKTEILYKQWDFFRWYLDKTFPIKFIHNSNNMEWSKIPEEEVEKIIQNKKYIYKIKNEIQEVKNSKNAWDFLNKNFVFNEANIKKVYHILTKWLFQETGLPYPRWFKKVPNIANNQATSSPENVQTEIITLLNNYKKNKSTIFPLQMAFDFHLKFEQIHPFENGNGRTGRLFMNKILMQNSMLPMIVFKENYKSYSNSIASCNTWYKRKYYKFMIEQYKKTIDILYEFKLWLFEEYNKSLIKLTK